MEEKKRCIKCNEILALSEFHKLKRSKDGHKSVCKICRLKPQKVKICAICGNLFTGVRDSKIFCSKKCATQSFWKNKSEFEKENTQREYSKKDYAKNKKQRLEANNNWRINNNKRTCDIQRNGYNKNIIASRFKNKTKQKTYSKKLTDSYVKRLITKRTSLKTKDIPGTLIKTYRERIKLHRLINELSN